MIQLKNRDLIEKLKEYNLDADVSLVDSEDITISYIYKDYDGNNLTPSTTPQLFVEGIDSCPSCIHECIKNNERICSFYNKPCRLVGECYQYEEYL